MRVIVLSRSKSEHATLVDEFIENYRSRANDTPIELIDIDSREGDSVARLYDVVRYPAIVVIRSVDGVLQKMWQGAEFPLIDELQAYIKS